jgi:membrane associated rhomboid family serine protease
MGSLTNFLLLAIGFVFILQVLTGLDSGMVTGLGVFVPSLAFSQPWRFLSSMFLHASLMHIFFNAYALFMFGSLLEMKVSKRDYLLIYFGAGIVGGMAYFATYLLGIVPDIPALGASGAIYGIMGAAAILLPQIRLFVFFFPMSIRQACVVWVILEFLGTFDTTSGIASAAHLGGLLFGLAWGWMLKSRVIAPPVYQIYGSEVE